MSRILVSGLINIETTLQVEDFPIAYEPVRFPFFGIQCSVSGVGYNVAKALTVLGDGVCFLSMIGGDMAGRLVLESLADDGIPPSASSQPCVRRRSRSSCTTARAGAPSTRT